MIDISDIEQIEIGKKGEDWLERQGELLVRNLARRYVPLFKVPPKPLKLKPAEEAALSITAEIVTPIIKPFARGVEKEAKRVVQPFLVIGGVTLLGLLALGFVLGHESARKRLLLRGFEAATCFPPDAQLPGRIRHKARKWKRMLEANPCGLECPICI